VSFTPSTFAFLRELAANNDREWFRANQARYERQVREPAIRFIEAFAPYLKSISGHFVADPGRVGGSMFRIHRDTRFSRDKRPYKTAVGIQFRHEQGRDAHAPGFYLHLEPGKSFVGVGVWRPSPDALALIRAAIVETPARWKRVLRDRRLHDRFELGGEKLKRGPRGFDLDHPLIEDLKRKDFIALSPLTRKVVVSADFVEEFADRCRAGVPLVRFLCRAVGAAF